jgi:hypothetical protein
MCPSVQGCVPPKMVLEMACRNGLEHKVPFKSEEEASVAIIVICRNFWI